MAVSPVRPRFSDRLTSRRGAWVALGVAALVMAVLFGALGGAEAPARTGPAPAGSESMQAGELMERFPNADRQSVLLVASRDDGAELSDTDVEALEGLLPVLDARAAGESSAPIVGDDGRAAIIVIPITVGSDGAETAEIVVRRRYIGSASTDLGFARTAEGFVPVISEYDQRVLHGGQFLVKLRTAYHERVVEEVKRRLHGTAQRVVEGHLIKIRVRY